MYIQKQIFYQTFFRRQIAQLDQVLQRTSSTPENRYSLSGENVNTYNVEPADPIQKCKYIYICLLLLIYFMYVYFLLQLLQKILNLSMLLYGKILVIQNE